MIKPALYYSTGEDISTVRTNGDSNRGRETISELAKQYVSLGDARKSKIDDNITDARKWDDEREEAEKFWKEKVEVMSEQERKQVEDFSYRKMTSSSASLRL